MASARRTPEPVLLRMTTGPREDWFGAAGLAALLAAPYAVSPQSNRVGARLAGTPVPRLLDRELESEGMVLGAIQVPPDGQPVVLAGRLPDDRRLPGDRGGRPARSGSARAGPPRGRRPVRPRQPGGAGVSGPIDLNCDLGEGFGVWRLGDDEAPLAVVTSANVACGFHAGDPMTMRAVTAQVATGGVAVGAHVSYRDLTGFGRRRMDIAPDELTGDVLYQLGALDAFCRVAGARVRYVKPHGALYNTTVEDEEQAAAVARAVRDYDASLPVLGLPGSALLRQAQEAGLPAVSEGFVDRAYTSQGRLVPRGRPEAVLTDAEAVVAQAVRMATAGTVIAVDGTELPMPVRSLRVHGDTPGAVALARRVRAALEASGMPPTPFAS